MANIPGTPKNDVMNGTNFDDILNQDGDLLSYPGTGGNDTVYGWGGNDRIYGGAGNDTLGGGDGNDRVSGGSGVDLIYGESGHDQLFGGADYDFVAGGAGNDYLDGGTGADHMEGGDGHDTYIVDDVNDEAHESLNDTEAGDDRVLASVTHTLSFGLEGLYLTGTSAINGTGNENNNTITGNDANNVLSGLDGNDAINGGNGNDELRGGNGNDVLSGNDGNDQVLGGNDHDTLYGFQGNDQLVGGNGNDYLLGGNGNDVLNGGAGTDVVSYENAAAGVRVNLALTGAQNTVSEGIDTLSQVEIVIGSSFNDTLTGNAANNSLYGDAGDDTLTGGLGADFLSGGTGNDRFDYNAVGDSPTGAGRDLISDFAGNGAGLGDRIDLTTIDANSLVTGNQAFTYIGSAAFTGAGQLRYSGGFLQGSTDGDTAAEFEIQLVGAPALVVGGTGTDILL